MTEQQPTPHPIEAVISALQSQRAVLGDAVVDAAVAGLQAQMAANGDRPSLAPVPVPIDSPEVGDADPQLKLATVLFADIVGSTAISQHLDAEDLNAVMDGALARFTAQVEAHRGRVLQYAGDSLLAVFGAPKAFEDDAERAVLAGLAILAQARSQAQALLHSHGVAGFNVRVGLHTGNVLLGGGVDGEHSIRGLSVSIAARMEQTAPPGTLRISQTTYRQVRGRFELLAQAPLPLKGLDVPMLTYLVQGPRAAHLRRVARGVDGMRPRMVGRSRELNLLQAAYARLAALAALPESAAQPAGPGASVPATGLCCITVVGEAGLGKSRLIDEFRHWAKAQAHGVQWGQAHASEQRIHQPYGLLAQWLSGRPQAALAAVISPGNVPTEQACAAWLDSATPLLANREDAAVLGHLLGFDFSAHAELRPLLREARQLRDRAFFHASQWLRGLVAQGAPLVAHLDDLHWADDGTLDFIGYLQASHADLPLLILATSRPSLFERRSNWAAAADATPQRIDLAALDAPQADELAQALLSPLPELPAHLQTLVTARAEGNPFFMEELVNMLIDQGVIQADGPVWQFHPERLQARAMPATLAGVLQARLDALPDDARRTAQLAAVVGHHFWDHSLAALGAPQAAPKHIPGAPQASPLQTLEDRLLTQAVVPSSLEGLREFAFKHHSLHQVAYDSVLKRHKRPLHAKVAHWLVSLPQAAPPELVAEHFERGGEPVQALTHWQRAAESAAARYANAAALTHAERALALLAPEALAARYALHRLMCRVLSVQSDRGRLPAVLDAMTLLADQLADPVHQCEALSERSRFHSDGGDNLQALAHAREAVARAPTQALTESAHAHARLAQCLLTLQHPAEAAHESDEALRLARAAQDPTIEGLALNDLAMQAMELGNYDVAITLYQQALDCHRTVGNRNNEGGTLSNLGYTALVLGDYPAACAQFTEARDLFARIGKRQNQGITLINLGIAHLNQGQAREASLHAAQALALLRASGDRWAEAAALRVLGQAAQASGQAGAALEHLSASRDLFAAVGTQHLALEASAALASLSLQQGDLGDALAHIDILLTQQATGVALDGVEEPLRLQLSCHQVLAAAGDARAPAVLAAAHQALMQRADGIANPQRRHTYLNAVPFHRDIVAAWLAQTPTASQQTGRPPV